MDNMEYTNPEYLSYEDIESFLDEESVSAIGYESSINIHNITHDDMLNGEGLRVVLWVAGCAHRCEGCQNPCTWDPNGGIPFTQWEEAEFWTWLDKPWTQGATFSGGDPLHPANREYIGKMMKKIKETRPGKDIWCYTGYTLVAENGEFRLEDAQGNSFAYPELKYIDVLVDGRFELKTRQGDIAAKRKVRWRGSSNQRLIDVPASLKAGKIVEKEEE